MDLFKELPQSEQDAICSYIENYAGPGADPTKMEQPLSHILRFWDQNKETLFELFGKKLIISKEISYTAPTEVLDHNIDRMMDNEGYLFLRNYQDMIMRLFPYPCWASSWNNISDEECDRRNAAESLIRISNLRTNIYSGKSFIIPNLHGNDIAIKTGCKVSKILGKIAAAQDLKGYEDFRIAHSMCLNQKKLEGRLCLSIHPLDFMTMSDNLCDWESCMSWQEDGSYRQGTVEMMNSSYIVIAYLESKEKMPINKDFLWSNKKWRQLFIVNPSILMGIKAYPYDCPECEDHILKMLRNLAETNLGWGPYNKNKSLVSNCENNLFADIGKRSYISFSMNHMYNDISSNHRAYVSISIPENLRLNLSGETECMTCGADYTNNREDLDTEALSCPECNHVCRCEECGDYCDIDRIICVDGRNFCPYCAENYTATCDLTGELHVEDYLVNIYLAVNNSLTGYNIQVYEDAIDTKEFEEVFGELHRIHTETWAGWGYDERVVNAEELSDRGWKIFFPYSTASLEELKQKIYREVCEF